MTKIIPRFPIHSYFIYSIVAKFVARATESPRNPVNKGFFAPHLFASKTACRGFKSFCPCQRRKRSSVIPCSSFVPWCTLLSRKRLSGTLTIRWFSTANPENSGFIVNRTQKNSGTAACLKISASLPVIALRYMHFFWSCCVSCLFPRFFQLDTLRIPLKTLLQFREGKENRVIFFLSTEPRLWGSVQSRSARV